MSNEKPKRMMPGPELSPYEQARRSDIQKEADRVVADLERKAGKPYAEKERADLLDAAIKTLEEERYARESKPDKSEY